MARDWISTRVTQCGSSWRTRPGSKLFLTGLSILSARIFGGALLWLLPASATLTALVLGSPSGAGRIWAWTIQPDNDHVALASGIILALIGAVAGWHAFDRRQAIWS